MIPPTTMTTTKTILTRHVFRSLSLSSSSSSSSLSNTYNSCTCLIGSTANTNTNTNTNTTIGNIPVGRSLSLSSSYMLQTTSNYYSHNNINNRVCTFVTNSKDNNNNATSLAKHPSNTTNTSTSTITKETKIQHAYIHKISQIILLHLQTNQYEWILSEGLDRGLIVNPNGTFILQFPPSSSTSTSSGTDSGRIWTSYDAGTKQHWISVYKQTKRIRLRFLLKDINYINPQQNNIPKYTTFRNALAENEKFNNHIRAVVDQLIDSISSYSSKK